MLSADTVPISGVKESTTIPTVPFKVLYDVVNDDVVDLSALTSLVSCEISAVSVFIFDTVLLSVV